MQRRPFVEALSFFQCAPHPATGPVHQQHHPYHTNTGDVQHQFPSRLHRKRWLRRGGRGHHHHYEQPHQEHPLHSVSPKYPPTTSFPFERPDGRFLMIYLALGAATACLIELPRRYSAHKHGAELRAEARDGCMKYSWKRKGTTSVAEDPYELEEESRRLRELTDPSSYQPDRQLPIPSNCLHTNRPKLPPA